MRYSLKLFVVAVALVLSACGHTPVSRTVSEALNLSASIDDASLNPSYRYLRVSVQGQTLLMVLGYVDASPDGHIETWYSKAGQVLRLKNGKLLSTRGLDVDWTQVRYRGFPTWRQATQSPTSRFTRSRDQMPGYRFDIVDTLTLREVRAPTNARLSGLKSEDLRWFEETADDAPRGEPSARYALRNREGEPEVVYGEQCLEQQFCLAWQMWPVTH